MPAQIAPGSSVEFARIAAGRRYYNIKLRSNSINSSNQETTEEFKSNKIIALPTNCPPLKDFSKVATLSADKPPELKTSDGNVMKATNCQTQIALLIAAMLVAPNGWACPAYLAAEKIPSASYGVRKNMKLFAIKIDPQGNRSWQSLPMQVDPLNEKGVLRPNPEGNDLADMSVEKSDRINLRREKFGNRLQSSDVAPCKTTGGIELKNPDTPGQYAYLVTCSNAADYAFEHNTPVSIDTNIHKITAPSFEYDYQPNNQLMYKNMIAKGKYPFKPEIAVANSDVNIHMNIKKFFTMDFTNKNVESYVTVNRSGPVGMVGSIDFFLRLLVFKIDLKMATTVGFYEDSGHIPSIIDVPRDAPKMLNPGSGLMYLWTQKSAKFDQSNPERTMPFMQPKAALAGWETHAKKGLPYCVGDTCNFRLRGKVVGESFGLDINVGKDLVERGFFPSWVPDVAQFKKDMGWDKNPSESNDVVGVYFENGGLLKGQYKLEQWIRIGSEESISTVCPRQVDVGDDIQFNKKPADSIAH